MQVQASPVYWKGNTGNLAWSTEQENWLGYGRWFNVGDSAIFDSNIGTTGAIQATGEVKVRHITFNTNGYSVSGEITLYNPSVAPVYLTVEDGVAATINSPLSSEFVTAVIKAGRGKLTFSGGLSDYTVSTIVEEGTLSVASLANGGQVSSIGASSADAENLQIRNGATLSYHGWGADTDRSLRIDVAGTIEASGTGALRFTNTEGVLDSNTDPVGVLSRVVTLGGDGKYDNLMALRIIDPAANSQTTLVKDGAGRWILSGANEYSGNTIVRSGTLLVDNATGSGLGSGDAVVHDTAVFGGTGAFTGALTVQSGGKLHPGAERLIETLGTGELTLRDGSTLVYEIDSSAARSLGADLLKVTGGLHIEEVALQLTDLAATASQLEGGTVFTLINYTGEWNGGLFTIGDQTIANGEEFVIGLNTWRLDYDALSGGLNFSDEYFSDSRYVNLVVIPEGGTLGVFVVGAIALLLVQRGGRLRRRQTPAV